MLYECVPVHSQIYADNIVGHHEPVMPAQHDTLDDTTPDSAAAATAPAATAPPPLEPLEHRLSYSSSCGRVHMSNVHISNAGLDWAAPGNVYWQHKVARREAVRVQLRGQAEFEAHDVRLQGSHTFEVPDGYRMVVTQDAAGKEPWCRVPLHECMCVWGVCACGVSAHSGQAQCLVSG